MDKNITQFTKISVLKPDAELHLVQDGNDYKTTAGDISGLSGNVVEIQEFIESNVAILSGEVGERWYSPDIREIREIIQKNQVTGGVKFKSYMPYKDAVYINLSDGKFYRWDGNVFVDIIKGGGAVVSALYAPKKAVNGFIEFTGERGLNITEVKDDTKFEIAFDNRFDFNKRLVINQVIVSQIIFPENIVWLEVPDFSQPGVYHIEFKVCCQDSSKLLALVTFKEPLLCV